ncbi:hypothetical protein Bpfe_004060 [Biomphalaria pfeifferi]|uniref:Uncharacterized protein n=1 Tax=Biomphalaria pfeifferi TaxID=112525 RepID=A0AAD8C5L6_BIOPF|nr:hypothetical protein Bpfe_004060 [Biomphalaria pfeifferi]
MLRVPLGLQSSAVAFQRSRQSMISKGLDSASFCAPTVLPTFKRLLQLETKRCPLHKRFNMIDHDCGLMKRDAGDYDDKMEPGVEQSTHLHTSGNYQHTNIFDLLNRRHFHSFQIR